MLHRPFFVLSVCAILLAISTLSAQARRDEVEDAQRLQFLRQATGNSTPSANSNSFQTRLNAIMDTTTSTERVNVAVDEYKERQRILAEEQAELKAEEELASPKPYKESNSLKVQDKTKIGNVDDQTRIAGTESEFQKNRDSIQAEFDARIQKKAAPLPSATPAPLLKETGTLSPSLANNPFYHAPETEQEAQASFQDRKPIIATRISGSVGIPMSDAEDLVSQVSSSEELILRLMQDYSLTYGEASDMAS